MAYTRWWRASMAISSTPHSVSGGVTSNAGSIICSLPHTAPRASRGGGALRADRREKPSGASPYGTVPPMDEVGELSLRAFVYRLDAEHLLGRLRRGRTRAPSTQLRLEGARCRHRRRSGHAGEKSLADCRRNVSQLHTLHASSSFSSRRGTRRSLRGPYRLHKRC